MTKDKTKITEKNYNTFYLYLYTYLSVFFFLCLINISYEIFHMKNNSIIMQLAIFICLIGSYISLTASGEIKYKLKVLK